MTIVELGAFCVGLAATHEKETLGDLEQAGAAVEATFDAAAR